MFGRAADAVEDTDAFERFAGSYAPTRLLGPFDLERTAGAGLVGLLPGDRSNRSASALTLLVTCGEERAGAADDAGPDTDLGVALEGGRTAPLAVGWRWRVAAMSRGAGTMSWWVVEV